MDVLRKKFESYYDFAVFALSDEAPRYSLLYVGGPFLSNAKIYGKTCGDALFSDDLDAIKRAGIRWEENGFKVKYDLGDDHREEFGDCVEDSWVLTAAPHVPEHLTNGDAPADVTEAEAETILLNGFYIDSEEWSFYDKEAPSYSDDDVLYGREQLNECVTDKDARHKFGAGEPEFANEQDYTEWRDKRLAWKAAVSDLKIRKLNS